VPFLGTIYTKENAMTLLKWAGIFFIIALVAALFGFTGIAEGAADVARFLFFLFIAIVVILVALGVFTYRKVTGP
jgi:uncharacterized membrane protein YtjA (UPF0391 family)